ncbi:MAG TPA: condensation domain-containing protein, partial [Chthonomonadaceae bacterium]|nr:condensation domain-containing protein [Chthonomonadaceae bacterium]
RFLKDPFRTSPDARMYRTGDLVKYLPDGNIAFLGRIDHQVKIRGYRIELGEIESVLRSYPDVREAVVLAREDTPGDQQLVAYVVARNGEYSAPALREYLRDKLPDFMLPRFILPLNRLPLTPNGKLDRAALPAPDSGGAHQEYVAPHTALEETLAQIWSQLLRRERVSVTDNFFDLGGHSLLALQVISRIRETLRVELPLKALFDAPTIVSLAERLSAAPHSDASVRPPVVRVARGGRLPLSYAQQRLWFIDQLEPGTYLYNVPISIRLRGMLNVEALRRALEEIVRRHEALRTTFAQEEGHPFQVIGEPYSLELPLTDLTGLPDSEPEAEAYRLAAQDAQRPFDLENGPLFRASLLRLGAEEHWLLVGMHHIVTDGWSSGVFFKELGTLYTDFCAGRPSSLPELPIQYADYAAWQRNWLQGDVLEEHLAFWRGRLAGAPALLELPTDRPRSDMLNPEGAWEPFSIPQATAEKLKAFSRQEGATLFMTLFAAYTILLSRYTRTRDIVVGTDVANRNARELEDLIGFFLNHVVLRADLSGSPTFREYLGHIHQVATEAFAHQEMPFDRLVEVLNPERRGNHTPLFQALFVLQNAPRAPIQLPGLTMNALKVEREASKYDIALFLSERTEGIAGTFLYKRDLFDRTTMETMRSRFETLLESIVAQPDTVIHTLEIQSEAEKAKHQSELGELRNSKLAMLQSATRKSGASP